MTQRLTFDVVFAGDFGSESEDLPGTAEAIEVLHRYGVNTGLVHLSISDSDRAIDADIHSQVLDGAVQRVNPWRSAVEAHTIVLTASSLKLILDERPVQHLFANQVMLLCDDSLGPPSWPYDLLDLQEQAMKLFGGSCIFSAVHPSRYNRLRTAEPLLPIAPSWTLSADHRSGLSIRRCIRSIAPHLPWRIGVFCGGGPVSIDEPRIVDVDPALFDDDWQLWFFGDGRRIPHHDGTDAVVIRRSEMTVERFLEKVDAAAFLTSDSRIGDNTTAVWKALRSGLPVIVPESCREDFGSGPLYRHPSRYVDTIRTLIDRPSFRNEIQNHTSMQSESKIRESSGDQLEMAELLTGRSDITSAWTHGPNRRRVLFMSSNGVGVGHLSRLISIARRLPDDFEPSFLSLSQALPVVRQFGFHGEFLAYHLSTLSDYENWSHWLQLTLEQIFEAYSIGTVVFDGSMPYAGLCRAVSTRNGRRLVWIRRGMWRSDQDNTVHLSRARYADLIIEPDDIATELDRGQAAAHRHEVAVVDPIRLLDPSEVLNRRESCRKLGLNERKRYALIQLGAGNNYANFDIIDHAISTLSEIGKVQPVIAEWLTAETAHDLWPEVPRLRCFPISRYYRAFDFTISAVGYNSFNEIISFALPSVLIPNLNQTMDDQSARAIYADNHEAAVHLDPDLRPRLREVIAALHDQDIRRNMVRNCRRLARPNGAPEAAALVAQVAAHTGDAR